MRRSRRQDIGPEPVAGNGLPVSERLSDEVLSLPMHPYLDDAVQDRIIAAIADALQ